MPFIRIDFIGWNSIIVDILIEIDEYILRFKFVKLN